MNRPLTRERLIEKHEKLMISSLISKAKPVIDTIRKAAGSAAQVCKLRNETFDQLVERLGLSDRDIHKLRFGGEQSNENGRGMRFYLERLGVKHLYTSKAEMSLMDIAVAGDPVVKALRAGEATFEDQDGAATLITWMSQFVPVGEFKRQRQRRMALDSADDLM